MKLGLAFLTDERKGLFLEECLFKGDLDVRLRKCKFYSSSELLDTANYTLASSFPVFFLSRSLKLGMNIWFWIRL